MESSFHQPIRRRLAVLSPSFLNLPAFDNASAKLRERKLRGNTRSIASCGVRKTCTSHFSSDVAWMHGRPTREPQELVKSVIRNRYDFDHDPEKLYAVRTSMGRELNGLSR